MLTQHIGRCRLKKKTVRRQPFIGDSLISAVNPKGLKQNVFKNGISGAAIDCILNKVKVFDLAQFSHIVFYVGGNDASNRSDIEYFEEVYERVISHIKQKNSSCKIFMCNSCPRGDTSTSEVKRQYRDYLIIIKQV